MSSITILGLGPGDANLLTRGAWEALNSAQQLYLRTSIHPTVAALPQHLALHSFDHLYDTADDFGAVYAQIASALIARAQAGEDVLYAVPGHPLVAESTTRQLLAQARAQGIATQIIAGLSFIEPVCAALEIDPLEHGMQLIDALDLIPSDLRSVSSQPTSSPDERGAWSEVQGVGPYEPPLLPFPLTATRPALICQIYSRNVASHVKLSLMERYPATHPITLVRAAGVAGGEASWSVPLHELDHQRDLDHLTSAYVPALDALDDLRGAEGLSYIVARLLGPGGCPWDREQTHSSIRSDLLEETHEVLEALDGNDMEGMSEELGDLMLNIMMHSEMARQAGDFDMGEVYEQVSSKLIRRHPHVFGERSVAGSADVLRNWDQIKQAERADKGQPQRGSLDGIPITLPALASAQKLTSKAAKHGFDWPQIDDAWAKLHEEMAELRAAAESAPGADQEQQIEEELGDLLFAASNLARRLGLDAESALRTSSAKFRRRFSYLEQRAQAQGSALKELSIEQMLALWQQAKQQPSS